MNKSLRSGVWETELVIPLYPWEMTDDETTAENYRKFRETPLMKGRKYRIEFIATDNGWYSLKSLWCSVDTSELVQNQRSEFKLVWKAADYESLFTLLGEYEAPYWSHKMAIALSEQWGFEVFEEVTMWPLKRIPGFVTQTLSRITGINS